MAENSKIEWTHHTFNPWRGCTKVAEGCKFCYADTLSKRNPSTLGVWGSNGTRVIASDASWKEPIKWNARAGKAGVRERVFCASLADVFEDWGGEMLDSKGNRLWTNESIGVFETDDGQEGFAFRRHWTTMADVRNRLFKLIDATPNLDWLILTKRPENIERVWWESDDRPLPRSEPMFRQNVWIGTSIATQEDADRNIPWLLNCRDFAKVLFLSMEPLVGPVELRASHLAERHCQMCEAPGIDWVIVGGESGPHARPMHPDWARSIRDQCQAADVPFFFKQWGEWAPADQVDGGVEIDAKIQAIHPSGTTYRGRDVIPSGQGVAIVHHAGKKASGRLLDGREWSEFPEQVEAVTS